MLEGLNKLYLWSRAPEYFAGGHAWSDGTVYRYVHEGRDYLLKVMPAGEDRLLKGVLERQAFQEYLNCNGVDTALPLRSLAGNLAESFTLEGKESIAYAWEMVPGNHCDLGDPRDCEEFYRRWGTMLGKMHRLARNWQDWLHSTSADAQGLPLICREREWNHFYHWFQDDEVRAAWLKMREALDILPRKRDNYGFLHNDPHPGNILQDKDRLVLIDFDVANYLWFVADIAICIYSEYSRVNFHSPYSLRNPELDSIFITPFMQAYEAENKLHSEEFANIELFLNYRRFLMFACFYDQIKDNAPQYLQIFKQNIIEGSPYLPENNWFCRKHGSM